TNGQTVQGTVTVTATASATLPATVQSVRLLVDGQPVGSALTTGPYTFNWDTTGLSNGSHNLSVVVTDSNLATGSAPTVPVTVANPVVPTVVTITAPTAGQSVSGIINVTATVTSPIPTQTVQFRLDGLTLGAALPAAPYTVAWDTKTSLNGNHTLEAQATDPDGNVVSSGPISIKVVNAVVCFNNDVNVVVKGRGAVTTTAFTTAAPGELLLAFVAADGPRAAGAQTATVSGGGLTWTLVKRANGQPGDAEVWQAVAPSVLTNAQITATPARLGYDTFLNVLAMQGTSGVGASAAGGASTGPPSVGLTTTQPQSLVFGVGHDWDNAVARSVGANQVIDAQWVDTAVGDTFWSQNTTVQSGVAGSSVALNDVAPTTDMWNLVAVEVLAANTSGYLGP
ncbi:MAG TPA: Ig-like domain-containing protein, partial [Acidimicrobiales bacterium]